MKAIHNKEHSGIHKRAAEIRRSWSSVEKIRRTGLPPDVPARLRQFILGQANVQWEPALVISTPGCGKVGRS